MFLWIVFIMQRAITHLRILGKRNTLCFLEVPLLQLILPTARRCGVKLAFLDRDPYYYTRRVKEAVHIRLHPNNINRVSGIEIPEAWMPTIKKHNNRRAVRLRTAEGANHL